ncbi:MAG: ATP-binding cassette domain-containing protein, partial [Blautia sp.]
RLRNWDEKTRIGVNGEKLSVGQQQRLAIARALASKAKVLVFDEIFRNLDAETTRRILSNLVEKGYILLYFEENEVLDKFQTREITMKG